MLRLLPMRSLGRIIYTALTVHKWYTTQGFKGKAELFYLLTLLGLTSSLALLSFCSDDPLGQPPES